MIPYLRVSSAVIPTYGVLFVSAVLAAGVYLLARTRREGKSIDDMAYLYVLTAICAGLGAKVVYALIEYAGGSRYPLWRLFGGSSVVGGVFGAGLGAFSACRFFGWNLRGFLPRLAPALPLAIAIIRVGCLCEGCCYGRPYAHGIIFRISPVAPNGVPLFPTQIVDSTVMLVLFCVMHVLSTRVDSTRLAVVLAACCTSARFVGDWFRGDAVPGPVPLLTMTQTVIIVMVPIAMLAAAMTWKSAIVERG